MKKRGQIGIEYIVLVGFLSVTLIIMLTIFFLYGDSLKNRIKQNQIDKLAKKIISTAETVYYYGKPTKSTIKVFIPEGVTIEINETLDELVVYQSNGINSIYFSKVPIEGQINSNPGLRYITIEAMENYVYINGT